MFRKKLFAILFVIVPLHFAHCADVDMGVSVVEESAISAEQLLAREPDATECATAVFANALGEKLSVLAEDVPETEIQGLIYSVFADGAVLERVLECPEIQSVESDDSIKFLPIVYSFPAGRKVVVNYETQPKILQHRLRLANKQTLPSSDPSPRLGDLDDPSVWVNTNPAWYGIVVTEAGALDGFVGNGHNNTISLKYIEDNIDTLMPKSSKCTSGSAFADDDENINLALTQTVGLGEEDTNDYYVSGDVNLQWVSYLEIGLDVVITVATFGGGAVISGVTKAARASRTLRKLSTGIKALAKTESVKDFVQLSQKYSKLTEKLTKLGKSFDAKVLEKYVAAHKKVVKLTKGKNITRIRKTGLDKDFERAQEKLAKMKPGSSDYIAQQAKVNNLEKQVQALDDLALDPNNQAARQLLENGTKTSRQSMTRVLEDGALDLDDETRQAIKEWRTLTRENPDLSELAETSEKLRELEKGDKSVKQYNEAVKSFSELNKYRHQLLALQRPAQRGNIARRAWRSLRATTHGTKEINAAQKVAYNTIKTLNKVEKNSLQALRKIETLQGKISKLDKVADSKKIASYEKEIEKLTKTAKKSQDIDKLHDIIQAEKLINSAERASQGAKATKTSANIGIKQGRLRDWLFHSTMKNANKLARFEQASGLLYGAIKFAGDMYDWTETSTGEFTNDIEFKPLLLLSADDLEGQDNVVNYGMWLLWLGDSYDAADDDAAYLQAMDFAETFYNDLMDIQDRYDDNSCNVDIFVVRPIIRNPDTENAELYYLIMNDVPWSTAADRI